MDALHRDGDILEQRGKKPVILTILVFLGVLGVLVCVHELGHYLAARHVGVHVERFSIGLPPKAWGRKVGETEFMLSWIPLGGYVKLLGQNLDDEDPSDPRNYAAKTRWQRFYILIAGVTMNLIAAFVLMAVFFMIGEELPAYRKTSVDVARVEPESIAAQAGLRPGDRIVSVDQENIADWEALNRMLARRAPRAETLTLTVQRNGIARDLPLETAPLLAGRGLGVEPLVEAVIGRFSPDSAAQLAGLRTGDRILAVNGRVVQDWTEMAQALGAGPEEVDLRVQRDATELKFRVQMQRNAEGRPVLGIAQATYTERHGPLNALGLSALRLGEITTSTFAFLGRLLSGSGSLDAVAGPVQIGKMVGFAARNGWNDLILLTAVISLQLAIFNLLPIPALDGGHIFLLGVEGGLGRSLSAKFRERLQAVGIVLLLTLIVVVTFNDVLRLLE